MKREFIINVVFVLGLNVLIKVFFIFGIDRNVQNLVGQTAYGHYFAILNLAYLFQIINDFGIQNFNNKHIAQHRQLLPKYLPNILVFKLLLGLIFMISLLLTGWVLGILGLSRNLLIGVGISQVLVAFIYYMRSNISALGHYRLDSIFSVLDKFLMILIIGTMLWVPSLRTNFNMNGFVWGQVAALGITALVSFGFIRSKIKMPRIRFHLPFLLVILKESRPYALLGLLMAIYNRVDSVLLAQMVSDTETGIYASAFRLMDAGTMAGLLISAFLLPMFVQVMKAQEPVSELGQLVIKMMWVVGILVVVPVIIYRLPIMTQLYTKGDAYSATVLGYLMVALLALMWSSVNGVLLIAGGAIRQLNMLYFGTVLLNLALNLYLIPKKGAVGAAISAAISQWAVTLYQYHLLSKTNLLTVASKTLWQIVLLPISSIGIAYGFSLLGLPWFIAFILSIGGILATSILLGLFSPQGLIKLLKNR